MFNPPTQIFLQERKLAGDIYINNLMTDLETAETEGQELQKEFDWILTLPPSAFASQEMLDWLRRDTAALAGDTEGDTDSELGLEISPEPRVTGARSRPHPGTVLLPDQVHPSPDQARSVSHSPHQAPGNVCVTDPAPPGPPPPASPVTCTPSSPPSLTPSPPPPPHSSPRCRPSAWPPAWPRVSSCLTPGRSSWPPGTTTTTTATPG